MFNAVVVGGGPGGSTVAWRLARAGRRVLVLDAAHFPRVKLCAGWVTRAALADLELDPAMYPETIQAFDAVSLTVAGREHRTCFERTASYGYLRLRRADYPVSELEKWAAKIRSAGFSNDVFVYFKHEDEAKGPGFAEQMKKLLP